MNHRVIGTLTALAALAALGVAYFAQYVLLLTPCELCLLERWPYRVVAVLGILAVLLGKRSGRVVLGLAALTMLGDVTIAGLHVGVEFGWWNSPLPECNGILTLGAPLPLIPSVPCDRPVFLIPHLPVSMAMMDFCAALAFALLLLAYVMRKPRRFG
ncbi:MAG TPA: disulfide bond formation protein B [Acidocella sp.]|nr:disulfide bond formation protein B [Acidocella sp.]